MKKFICILLALLPLFAVAKDDKNKKEDNYNPKYLAGAVTLTNGKVVFDQTFNAPSLSKDAIFDQLLTWANERFQPVDDMHSRVVYSNKEDGQIAAMGEEYIVFTSSALSLDRTRIYYQLSMFASEGSFKIEMSRIRYWYDENRDGGEKYTAEEWIVDDMALAKKKTKLAPICGKFRRETIDLKDELFKQAMLAVAVPSSSKMQTAEAVVSPANQVATAISAQTATSAQAATTQVQTVQTATPVQTVQPATPVQATKAPVQTAQTTPVAPTQLGAKKELVAISLNQLPSNLNEIAAAGRLTITAGEEEIEVKPEAWGGFGKLLNKDVTYTLIDKSRIAISLIMEHSDTYKISFYQNGSADPYVTIDCKKTMKQELTSEELKSLNQQVDGNKQYVMYIGAVTRCMKQN